jgi:selenide,water dikinase
VLVLGKPLGVGILSAGLKKGLLSADGYATMVDITTRLNTPGPDLAAIAGVHAMTDVTGFALLGHAYEICRGSKVAARLRAGQVPLIGEALDLARQGIVTGASARNWASYGASVELYEGMPAWQQNLLTDPQTSGGLLVSCAPEAVPEALETFRRHGFDQAAVIGAIEDGPPRVVVDA